MFAFSFTKNRFLSVLSAGCTLLLLAVLAGCGEKEQAPAAEEQADPNVVELTPELQSQIQTAQVQLTEIRDVLRVPGSIQVDEQRVTRIGASVTGRITDINVILGEDVKEGQVLATVNSTELAQHQLVYIKALQQIDLQTKAVERARLLLESDVISAAELQRREAELAAARADLSAARDQLTVLGMSPANIAKIAKTNQMYSFSNVDARISGTVIRRKVNLGQVVQPAEELFVVADLSHVWAVAEVPEQQADLIEEDEDVTIEIPALGNKQFTGKLIFVGDIVNPQTRTVTVRTDLANSNHSLKPDMLASMVVKSAPVQRLAVPSQGVLREDDRDYVFVQIAPNKFRLREVTLGSQYNGMISILGGISEGEVVIGEGAYHVNNERKRQELE